MQGTWSWIESYFQDQRVFCDDQRKGATRAASAIHFVLVIFMKSNDSIPKVPPIRLEKIKMNLCNATY